MFPFLDFNQYWPTYEQQLLLKACLLDQKQAVTAYNQWIKLVDIDVLDDQSNQLLGLLYRNLTKQQIESEHLGRLKGINRYQWTKNQLIIGQLTQIFQQFQQGNIDFICLGTLAILSHCYQDYGSKFIHNLSFLVHQNDLVTIAKELITLGWEIQTSQSNHLSFKNDKNQRLLCQSRLFIAQPQKHTNNQIWQQTISTEISRSNIKILSTIDTFLFICLQSNKQERLPITKMADIMMLIDKDDIDWAELVTKTQRYRLILPVRNMLSCISNIFDVSLPDWLLPSLYEMPISDYELLNYRIPALSRSLKLKSLFLKIKQTLR